MLCWPLEEYFLKIRMGAMEIRMTDDIPTGGRRFNLQTSRVNLHG
jgi:hypothetical protein